MKILVLNGPNLNLLGLREPELYGHGTYQELTALIQAKCDAEDIEVTVRQSNHEGVLVDEIQRAYDDGADGIVINPAAYTHTSIAILDALKAVAIPAVEVHLTDVNAREDFRKISYVRQACIGTVAGHGFQGYLMAIDTIKKYCNRKE